MMKARFSTIGFLFLALLLQALAGRAWAYSGGGDGLYGSYQYCGSGYTSSGTCTVAASMTRVDSSINFSGSSTTPPVAGTNSWNLSSATVNTNDPVVGTVTSAGFRVTWTGALYAPVEGTYTIYVQAADGIQVYLNGANTSSTTLTTTPLVFSNSGGAGVDPWANNSVGGNELQATVTLNANSYNLISISYRDDASTSPTAIVKWAGPAGSGISKAVIAQQYLYSQVNKLGDGLYGNYYGGGNFSSTTAGTYCNYGINWSVSGSMSTSASPSTSYASCVPSFSRVDPTINLVYPNAGTDPPDPSIGGSQWGTVWTGTFMAPETGVYQFELGYQGAVRFFMDDDSSTVSSGESASPATATPQYRFTSTWASDVSGTAGPVTLHLTAGKSYRILIEYRHQTGGTASVNLEWTHPGAPVTFSTVPVDYLYSDSNAMLAGVGTTTCTVGTRVQVYYFKAMGASAATVADYSLKTSGGVAVALSSATLSADGLMVTLVTSTALTAGSSYTLTVNNVQDTVGNTITPNTTFTFTPQTIAPGHGLVGDYFNQKVGGTQQETDYYNYMGNGGSARRVDPYIDFLWPWFNGVSDNVCSPAGTALNYPNTDVVTPVPTLPILALGAGFGSVPTAPCNYYSVRWFGQVTAPADGLYTFTTDSDDGVRLVVNNQQLISNLSPHTFSQANFSSGRGILDNGSMWMKAGTWYDLRMEYFNRTNQSVIALSYCTSGNNCSSVIPNADLRTCSPFDHFTVAPSDGTYSASTCPPPKSITITAVDASGYVYTGYTGTVQINTTDSLGVWTKSATALGTLVTSGTSTGWAQYTFANTDNGSVILNLQNTHADNVNVTVVDLGQVSSLSSMAQPIAFAWDGFAIKDQSISQYAGLPQQMTVTAQAQPNLNTTDKINCPTLTDYNGKKSLRAWLTLDPAYSSLPLHTAALPTLTDSLGNTVQLTGTQPTSDNVTLNFTNGVTTANFPINSSDVGAFKLNLLDVDTTTNTAAPFSGYSSEIFLPPFYFVLSGTANFSGDGTSDGSGHGFIGSGADPSHLTTGTAVPLTVTPYLWSQSMDSSTTSAAGLSAANLKTSGPLSVASGGVIAKSFNPNPNGTLGHNTQIVIPTATGTGTSGAMPGVTSNIAPGAPTSPGATTNPTGLADKVCPTCQLSNTTVVWQQDPTTKNWLGTTSQLSYSDIGYALVAAWSPAYLDNASATTTTALAGMGWIGRFTPDHYDLTSPAVNSDYPIGLGAGNGCSHADTVGFVGEWYKLGFELVPKYASGSASFVQYRNEYQKFASNSNANIMVAMFGTDRFGRDVVFSDGSLAAVTAQTDPGVPQPAFQTTTGVNPSSAMNVFPVGGVQFNSSGTSSDSITPAVRLYPTAITPFGPYSGIKFGIAGSDEDSVFIGANSEFLTAPAYLVNKHVVPLAVPFSYTAYSGRLKVVDTYGASSGTNGLGTLQMPWRFEVYDYTNINDLNGTWKLANPTGMCQTLLGAAPLSSTSSSSSSPYVFGNLYISPSSQGPLPINVASLSPTSNPSNFGVATTSNYYSGKLFFTNNASNSGSLTVTLGVPYFLSFDWTGAGLGSTWKSFWSNSGTCDLPTTSTSSLYCPSANLTFGIFSDKNAGTSNTGQVIFQLQSQ